MAHDFGQHTFHITNTLATITNKNHIYRITEFIAIALLFLSQHLFDARNELVIEQSDGGCFTVVQYPQTNPRNS